MGFVYILRSLRNNRYYIGSTSDVLRRLQEHNSGKVKYTALTRPFELLFYQKFDTLLKARSIEYKLKNLKSKTIIDKIVKNGIISIKGS